MTPNERTKERAYYAAKRRNDLVEVIAPDLKCAECGYQASSPSELVVDHVNGRKWNLYAVSASMRYARYWREFHGGVPLRGLCSDCNGCEGGRHLPR